MHPPSLPMSFNEPLDKNSDEPIPKASRHATSEVSPHQAMHQQQWPPSLTSAPSTPLYNSFSPLSAGLLPLPLVKSTGLTPRANALTIHDNLEHSSPAGIYVSPVVVTLPILPGLPLLSGNAFSPLALRPAMNHSPEVVTPVAQPSLPANYGRRPVSGLNALHHSGYLLSAYEKREILDYKEVWFVGRPSALKVQGSSSLKNNFGFDDERGDYRAVLGDHLMYRYEVLQMLGRGSFGQVLRCKDHVNGREVAIKIIRNKKRFQRQAHMEASILATLQEEDVDDKANIVRMLDTFTFRSHLCISCELLGINLYENIKASGFRGAPSKFVRHIAEQLLSTLALLHKLNVCHADLKPENILLLAPGTSKVKVIDFGSSCYVDQRLFTYIQSRFYRAPEVILGLPYDSKIDIWSLGCILAELSTGHPLFPGEDESEQLYCIMEVLGLPHENLLQRAPRTALFFDKTSLKPLKSVKGKDCIPGARPLHMCLRGCTESLFIDFLRKCLMWRPEDRMTPIEAAQHPWIMSAGVGVPEQIPKSLRSKTITRLSNRLHEASSINPLKNSWQAMKSFS